jgi:hypothetical protein
VPASLKVASHLPQLTTLSASRTVSRPSRRSRRRSATRHSGGLGPSEMRFGQVEAVEASLTAPWPHNALSATPDKARPPLPHSGGVHNFCRRLEYAPKPSEGHRHPHLHPGRRSCRPLFPLRQEGARTYRWTGAQLRVVHSPHPRTPPRTCFEPVFCETGAGGGAKG